MKPGLTPFSVVVTGTTFFGRRMELVSSGFAESVMTVAFDLSAVTPLISIGNDCGVYSGFTSLTMISLVWLSRVAQPWMEVFAKVTGKISSPRFRLNI